MRLPYAIRSAAGDVIGRIPVPVLGGPNRGRLWSAASAGRGYVSGGFERERVASMLAVLGPGHRFWDAGAHKGYVTLAAARRVGRRGRVLAFEPSRRNLPFLHRHVAWNGTRNVEVLPVALAAERGEAPFGGNGSSIAYRLGQGDETVEVRTIAGLVADGHPPPDVLKVDVEGAEADLLRGAGRHLDRVRAVFVALHHREAHDDCRAILEGAGFRLAPSRTLRAYLDGAPWREDPDLLAYRPGSGLTPETVMTLPGYA